MAADASIYGQIRPVTPLEGPLDQYGKVLNLKALMGQSKLHDLQTQQLEQNMGEEQATRDVFKNAAPGATLESLLPDVMRASPKAGISMTGQITKQKQEAASTAHTEAQTADIKAGDIAGAWATLAKGGGSDQSLQEVHDTMVQKGMPEAQAQAVTSKLQALPPEMRLAWMTAQAGQHKTGQEALKLFFPPAHMQDTGAQVTPVSTSTIPGGPAAGTPIPGGQPLVKTQTPDSLSAQATSRRGQDMTDARQRELNGIMEGQGTADITPTATAIANHDIPLPNPPSGSRNPMAMVRYNDLVKKVKEINPTYNAADYPVSVAALKAFGPGKQGQETQAANTGVNHLATLEQLALAQKNGNIQFFNKVANEISAQTGGTAPTTFKAALTMVAPEITKAVVGAGGGVEDRAKSAAALNPNYSPDQFLTAAGGMKELFAGRLSEAERTYARTTLRKDFRDKLLSPAAKEILDKKTNAASGGGKTSNPELEAVLKQYGG